MTPRAIRAVRSQLSAAAQQLVALGKDIRAFEAHAREAASKAALRGGAARKELKQAERDEHLAAIFGETRVALIESGLVP